MANEDLTTYTLNDGGGYLSIDSANLVTWTNQDEDQESSIGYDYSSTESWGKGGGNFLHQMHIKCTADGGSRPYCMMLNDTQTDGETMKSNGTGYGYRLRVNNSKPPELGVGGWGTKVTLSGNNIQTNIDYYVDMEFDDAGDTLYGEWFTDSSRTTSDSSGSISNVSGSDSNTYGVVIPQSGRNKGSTGNTTDGEFSDYDIGLGGGAGTPAYFLDAHERDVARATAAGEAEQLEVRVGDLYDFADNLDLLLLLLVGNIRIDIFPTAIPATYAVPNVTLASASSVAVTAAAMQAVLPSVTPTADANVSPATVIGTFAVPAVSVGEVSGVSLLPATATYAAAVVSADAPAIVAVQTVAGTFVIPAVTADAPASVGTTTVAGTFSVPAVTVSAASDVAVTSVGATYAASLVTAGSVASVGADPIVGTFAVPNVTLTSVGADNITLQPAVGAYALPSVTANADATTTAAAVSGTFSVPNVTLVATGQDNITLQPAVATYAGPAPSLSASATAASDPVVGTFSVPAVTVAASASVSVDPGTGTFAVPTVTTTAGSAVHVMDPVPATWAVPAPAVTAPPTIKVPPVGTTFIVPDVTLNTGGAQNISVDPATGTFGAFKVQLTARAVCTDLTAMSYPFGAVYGRRTGAAALYRWDGDLLPIEVKTAVPTVAPANGKGIVFVVSGGALTVYAWDPATSGWVS